MIISVFFQFKSSICLFAIMAINFGRVDHLKQCFFLRMIHSSSRKRNMKSVTNNLSDIFFIWEHSTWKNKYLNRCRCDCIPIFFNPTFGFYRNVLSQYNVKLDWISMETLRKTSWGRWRTVNQSSKSWYSSAETDLSLLGVVLLTFTRAYRRCHSNNENISTHTSTWPDC